MTMNLNKSTQMRPVIIEGPEVPLNESMIKEGAAPINAGLGQEKQSMVSIFSKILKKTLIIVEP